MMSTRKFWFVGLIFCAILGVTLVLAVTRWGPFVSDDSYHYIKPVQDALAGKGFEPSPIFAPALPLMLIPLGWLGTEPLVGIRWLNAFLFGINILLGGWLVKRMGALSGFALLAALWMALAENALEAHAWAMSEALCITCTLLALFLAFEYLESPRWFMLMGSGIMAALACLTRYAALPVVAAILLALISLRLHWKWSFRLGSAAVFAIISLSPMLLYMWRSARLLGRPLYYSAYTSEPFTLDNLTWYIYNTLNWFVPGRLIRGYELLAGLGVLLLLGVGALVWRFYRRRRPGDQARISSGFWLLLLYVLMNYLMLFFARGLTGLAAYNARYLVPPLLVFLLAMAYLLSWFWQSGERLIRVMVVVLCVGFVLYYGYRVADYTWRTAQTGLGYLNSGWHESETIPYLKQHLDKPMVATGDVGIYFWTGQLPATITAFATPGELKTYLCENDGLLVIMYQMPTEIYHIDEGEWVDDLLLMHIFNDSRVYACSSSP